MGFSEKMRESLGAGGVRLSLAMTEEAVPAGGQMNATLTVRGGNRPAHIEGVVVRVVEADRYWNAPDGTVVPENQARDVPPGQLLAAWERRTIGEYRVDLHRDLAPDDQFEIHLNSVVPMHCRPSSIACVHTLNVQADIRGQIDPTANAMIRIAPSVHAEPSAPDPDEVATGEYPAVGDAPTGDDVPASDEVPTSDDVPTGEYPAVDSSRE